MNVPTIKTLSAFSGIGGFSLACRTLGGFEVKLAIEIDPFRQQVLRKNFPNLNIHDDICTYEGKKEDDWDLLISTFPCVGMSEAGKGQGYDNPKSKLWWESYRIIKESKPKFVVIENVFGFVNRGLRECIASLRVAGYQVETPQIVSAKEVGACHERKRVFVVSCRQDIAETIFESTGTKTEDLTDSNGIIRRGRAESWGRQIRGSIEEIRILHPEVKNPTHPIDIQYHPQSESRSLQRGRRLAKETETTEQKGIRIGTGGSALSCRESDPRGMQLSSQPERVPDGVSSWLDGYYRDGWWLNNPFLGITAAPKHSVPDRQKRMQALGDSCTPQQAAVPLMRVKYLWDLIHE